jgi:ketosteroid isomerase-like protein
VTQLRLASALLLSLVLASGARALEAGKPLPEGPEGEVLAAEAERQRAFIDADVDAVGRLCGDELRVTHANGSVQTKYRLIAALESGRLDYVAIQSSGEEVHVYGEAAVLAGTARVQIKLPDGARRTIESVYTAVYAKRDGAWLLVAYQSTEAAKDPEPATS